MKKKIETMLEIERLKADVVKNSQCLGWFGVVAVATVVTIAGMTAILRWLGV